VFPAWLTCTRCGLSRTQRLDAGVGWSYQLSVEGRDPCFRLPLWLQKPTRHGLVFAFNRRNLSALETFVGTTLRERYALPTGEYRNRTLQSRLPRWMKLAANREEVVRALERLHEKLASTRP
jgi:hypothetical protein